MKTLEQRFWQKVAKAGPDECWLWTGALNNHGYGILRWPGGRITTAHRTSMILDGRDPGPLLARHTCDNPRCVNPAHLIPGTHAQNMADARERGGYRGERNGRAKLTEADAREILRLARAETHDAVARRFGVSRSAVTMIVQGRRWPHLALEAA